MDTNLLNNYVLKAIDAFPHDLEEVVENLNYALSYNSKNVHALYLMGRLQGEILGDYEQSKLYFAEALAVQIGFHKIYPRYIQVLLWNEDLNEAQKLIDFALTIKGIDKGVIWRKQGRLLEINSAYKKAIKAFKTGKLYGFNDDFIYEINNEISRVKNKVKSISKTKKKHKKKKNKK